MKLDFQQDIRGLGESGLVQTDELVLFINDIEVKTFDNYHFVHSFTEKMRLSPSHSRICFVANKYPEGTFPALDDELEGYGIVPLVLCVFDIYERTVVKEIPLEGVPRKIIWDEGTDLPVVVKESVEIKGRSVHEAKSEYDKAREYMNHGGTIKPEDPINDPTRLEYWLFYYDERYIRETPFEYASRMRNQYLKEHDLPLPYETPGSDNAAVSWDTSKPFSPSEAREEVKTASNHVRSLSKTISGDDPIYNPTRLEYYMFEHNPKVSVEDTTAYSIRRRNEYLKTHGIPVPYEKDILDEDLFGSDSQKDSGIPAEADRKRSNALIIVGAVVVSVLFLAVSAFLLKRGKTDAAGGTAAIPLFIIYSAIFRITRGYQPRIPGRYNLWRVLLCFGLLFSSATYQIAKLVNRLVGFICGGVEYPSWTFLGASALFLVIWIVAAKKKNLCLDLDLMDDAKRWGWVIPVCIALILGFFIYAAMAYK